MYIYKIPGVGIQFAQREEKSRSPHRTHLQKSSQRCFCWTIEASPNIGLVRWNGKKNIEKSIDFLMVWINFIWETNIL